MLLFIGNELSKMISNVSFSHYHEFLDEYILKDISKTHYLMFKHYKQLLEGQVELVIATRRESLKSSTEIIFNPKELRTTQDIQNILNKNNTTSQAYLHLIQDEQLELVYAQDASKIPSIPLKVKGKAKVKSSTKKIKRELTPKTPNNSRMTVSMYTL